MSGLVSFSRTLSVLAGELLLVLYRVPAMNWIIGRPRGRRSGIRTARCGRGRGEGMRVIPQLGLPSLVSSLSLGGSDGIHVGELGTEGHAVFVLWWFAGLRMSCGSANWAQCGTSSSSLA